MRTLTASLVVLGFAVSRGGNAQAAPEIALQTVLTGLDRPTAIGHAGDPRLFLTLQRGRIVVVEEGRLLPAAFLDIQSSVSCCGEQGLLGLAFHPRYAETGFFFVDYTNSSGNTVIARYRVSPSNPNAADPASVVVLLTIPQPFSNHNGGQLAFGPDGYLYIGMGDGGSANDPMCNGQREDTLLGKILRIDVDTNAESSPFYGIPPDNPFASPGGARDEIWAKGLRNPWRFSFDRTTGDLYVGDVGQGTREEVDFQPAGSGGGQNYGWKVMEGTQCGGGGTSGCPSGTATCGSPGLMLPILEYPHSDGDCSITGGYVYRGTVSSPRLRGVYLYGDYCTGKIWGATRGVTGAWSNSLFSPRAVGLTTFGEDAAGEIYLATEGGQLARIREVNPLAPTVVSVEPVSGSTRGGEAVVVAGSGFVPEVAVTFGGVTAPSAILLDPNGTRLLVTAPPHAAGTVDVVVTNPDGSSAALPGAYTFSTPPRAAASPRAPRVVTRP